MDPVVAAPAHGTNAALRLGPRLLLPAATVAVAAIGLRVPGLGAVDAVAFALTIAWALAGLAEVVGTVTTRTAEHTTYWLIEAGALTAAVALTAARIAGQDGAGDRHQTARVLATLAAPLVIAISFHFLIALPDGRLGRPGRRITVGFGYASAAGTGIGLALAGQQAGEAVTAGQTPSAGVQGDVNAVPFLSGRFRDGLPQVRAGPAARARLPGVCPSQDLSLAQRRQISLVADSALFG